MSKKRSGNDCPTVTPCCIVLLREITSLFETLILTNMQWVVRNQHLKKLTPSLTENGFFSFPLQELEIQARAHGLTNMPTALGTVELSSHLLKQQQQQQSSPQAQQPLLYQEDPNSDYLQRIAVVAGVPSLPSAGGPQDHIAGADGCTTFSDPLSHFTDFFSATLKEEHQLDKILMEDPLSPFGADPLLSATSPGAASKDSSRRSSFSSAEGDDL